MTNKGDQKNQKPEIFQDYIIPPSEIATRTTPPYMNPETEAFIWDSWQQDAISKGVPQDLANQGRAVIRELYQHSWNKNFRDELAWSAMIHQALTDPDYAMRRWTWLEISDGELALEPDFDFLSQEEIDRYYTPPLIALKKM